MFDFDEEDLPRPSAITTLIRHSYPMPSLPGGRRGNVAHNNPLLRRAGLGPFSKRLVVDNFSKSFEIPSVPFTKHPIPMPLGWLIHPQILRKRQVFAGTTGTWLSLPITVSYLHWCMPVDCRYDPSPRHGVELM